MKPLLLLSTLHRNHAARSGYQALAAYLPEARYLHTIRADPPGGLPLLAARLARRVAFSRWYLGGSAALEAQAWRQLRAGFSGIVHSMWADHDLGFLDLLLDRRRHRLVGTFHNCDDTFIHTIRFPRRLRRFDAIILMSRTQAPFFLEAGVKPERIHVVPHGIDTDYFHPIPQAPDPSSSIGPIDPIFTVLSAGGYRRNFPLLREVCQRLQSEPAIRFEIIAPESFRKLFTDVPNARFRTALADAEFLTAYQTASCLLQTVENATANNVILEAMACAQPIVAEKIGGLPEYLDSTCAILTPPANAEALTAALLSLHRTPSLRETLATGARKKAQSLDWKTTATQMRKIYEHL
jgi:glycosyltransferase involved in cell wall biosynthesis